MRNYYCLADDGELWILGEHRDFEAAETTAVIVMGLNPIWILDSRTADRWRATLTKEPQNESR